MENNEFSIQSVVNDTRVTTYPTLEIRSGRDSWRFVDHEDDQLLRVGGNMELFRSFPFTYTYSKKSEEATPLSAEIKIQSVAMFELANVLNEVVLAREPVLMFFREYLSQNRNNSFNESVHEMVSVRLGLTEASIQCSLYYFNSSSFPPFRATSDAFPLLLS